MWWAELRAGCSGGLFCSCDTAGGTASHCCLFDGTAYRTSCPPASRTSQLPFPSSPKQFCGSPPVSFALQNDQNCGETKQRVPKNKFVFLADVWRRLGADLVPWVQAVQLSVFAAANFI